MTEKKQITIYDLLPLLRPGYVAMNEIHHWLYCYNGPMYHSGFDWYPEYAEDETLDLTNMFNIAPFDGDWKDSLMEVK